MKGKTVTGVAAAGLFAIALPFPAFARLGDVISSLYVVDGLHCQAYSVARDDTYVYYVTVEMSPVHRLQCRYPNGQQGEEVFIGTFPAYHGDGDRSVLGMGYFADVYRAGKSGPMTITDFDVSTGSLVASWMPFEGDIRGYACSPALGRKYVAHGNQVYRYDTAGSLLSSFVVSMDTDGLAVTEEFLGKTGEYIIVAAGTDSYVYNSRGVVIGSFSYPKGVIRACACGPGYPSEYGTTYWCLVYMIWGDEAFIVQLSLHNAPAVAPASVGRIKALFR